MILAGGNCSKLTSQRIFNEKFLIDLVDVFGCEFNRAGSIHRAGVWK